MLDLKEVTADFIRTNLQQLGPDGFEGEDSFDRDVIQAITEKGMAQGDREKGVREWLTYYKVLMFFPPANSEKIAREIIKFADETRDTKLPLSRDSINSEFERLRVRIRQFARVSSKSDKPQEVTSLTSKALWCCYPFDVPIYDNYALRALQVISRLSRIETEENQSEYARFVDAWFQVYGEIEPVLDHADLHGYPYKVRVLDRLLWFLGQPNFDTAPKVAAPVMILIPRNADETFRAAI